MIDMCGASRQGSRCGRPTVTEQLTPLTAAEAGDVAEAIRGHLEETGCDNCVRGIDRLEATVRALEARVAELESRRCCTCQQWDGPRNEAARIANAAEYGGDGTGPFSCSGMVRQGNVVTDGWTVAEFACANWQACEEVKR